MIRLLALSLGLAICVPTPVARATPFFMGLGDLPGGVARSAAAAVSADGSTVVGSSSSGSSSTLNYDEAFRWTAAGGMVGLGDLPGGAFASAADAVSGDGSVVVGRGTREPDSFGLDDEAFLWTEAAGMVGLGDLPGEGFFSAAHGISADGSVVVGHSDSEPFRWSAHEGMVGLGILHGLASGVSADGSVVVGTDCGGACVAFRWTGNDGEVTLGIPAGADWTEGSAISADGSTVVGQIVTFTDVGPFFEAFRWTAQEGMVGLGTLGGGALGTFAEGVSADGSVVVGHEGGEGQYSEGFIWDPIRGMRPLRAVLVNEYGLLEVAGWPTFAATGISADGRTIVGTGINPSGFREAWIAYLPEPGVAPLVAIGFAGLLLTRVCRRRVATGGGGLSNSFT